jgi:hypothetical protein
MITHFSASEICLHFARLVVATKEASIGKRKLYAFVSSINNGERTEVGASFNAKLFKLSSRFAFCHIIHARGTCLRLRIPPAFGSNS